MEIIILTWGALIVLTSAATIYLSLVYMFGTEHDDQEPPAVTNTVPYIGHLLGLLWWGQHYFERIR